MNDDPTRSVCPYCGDLAPVEAAQCESCGGRLDPLSRQASQNAMGPWFVRDEVHPFRPGCSYATLLRLIARGKVTADTILRGPTTHQFWATAERTPGVAHRFGRCHQCRQYVQPDDVCCEYCGARFVLDQDRQRLGLIDVHDPEELAEVAAQTEVVNRVPDLASIGHQRLREMVSRRNPAGGPKNRPSTASLAEVLAQRHEGERDEPAGIATSHSGVTHQLRWPIGLGVITFLVVTSALVVLIIISRSWVGA